MIEVAYRKLAAVIASAALVASFALALVSPQVAEASGLLASGVSTQSGAANTTLAYAEALASGDVATGAFEYKNNSDDLESYWYGFRTSGRNSVYTFQLDALSGKPVIAELYDGGGKNIEWIDGDENIASTASGTNNRVTCTSSGLDKNSQYYIRVKPYKWGMWVFEYGSNYVEAGDQYGISFTEHPVIKKVTGVKASKKAKRAITVKWTKQTNATKYQIKYKTKGGNWKTVTTTKNSVKLAKLKKGTSYQVKVRAYCVNGWDASKQKASVWSSWSSVRTVKTKA